MASLTQWTWVWVSSGSWRWTGKPGVLQSMGSQRVQHDWVTELNWWELWSSFAASSLSLLPYFLLILSSFVLLQSNWLPHCSSHTLGIHLPLGPLHLQFLLPDSLSLLLLLSRFSRVQLCATPETAAHQAPPSLGLSRQEHWSGLPFPSPMQESEKWKWSRSVIIPANSTILHQFWTNMKFVRTTYDLSHLYIIKDAISSALFFLYLLHLINSDLFPWISA